MITLTSLQFNDEKSNFVLQEEFYSLIFQDEALASQYIANRKTHWEGILLMKLTISPNFNETLKIVEIKKVFRYTARKLGLSVEAMLGKTRKREIVDARRYALTICRKRGMSYQMISEQIGLDRTTIMHHEKVMSNLLETDSTIFEQYYELEDYVLIQISGEHKQDGSGEKLETNDKQGN